MHSPHPFMWSLRHWLLSINLLLTCASLYLSSGSWWSCRSCRNVGTVWQDLLARSANFWEKLVRGKFDSVWHQSDFGKHCMAALLGSVTYYLLPAVIVIVNRHGKPWGQNGVRDSSNDYNNIMDDVFSLFCRHRQHFPSQLNTCGTYPYMNISQWEFYKMLAFRYLASKWLAQRKKRFKQLRK